MLVHSSPQGTRLLLALLVLSVLAVPAWAQSGGAPRPVRPGEPFPAGVYDNLNAEAGGPDKIDLGEVLGKKPIVLHYWIPTNFQSEELFQQVQALAEEIGPEKLALYGVAVPRPPRLDVDKIRERTRELGIRVPVLNDDGYDIGQKLNVQSVPNISILDKEGRLRLTNGASLLQVLGYKLDLEKAIRDTAETGRLMTFGALDRYDAVKEMEGKPCPDFTAPLLSTSVDQSWQSLRDDRKVNVLVFWTVDCPHCRKFLPEINAWLVENPGAGNIISIASVANDSTKLKTADYCRANDFKFPVLVDRDSRLGKLFRVSTTPTLLFIGPDGVIKSASTSGHSDFARTIEEMRRKLL